MNLRVMSTNTFDIILGRDWLSQYRAMVDWYYKKVTLFPHHGKIIPYQASSHSMSPSLILKDCIGGKKKLKYYRSLFAIDGEMGTID